MAITAGAIRGQAPYQVNGAEATAPVRLGASAFLAAPAASVTVTLPTDTAGNAYAAFRITAAGSAWFGFGSGPATVGGANEWLITPGMLVDVIPPVGSTQLSAILDTGVTTGSVCVVGIY